MSECEDFMSKNKMHRPGFEPGSKALFVSPEDLLEGLYLLVPMMVHTELLAVGLPMHLGLQRKLFIYKVTALAFLSFLFFADAFLLRIH